MGCLKGGVVADVVIPTPDYVRFATHYRFRPDFCHANDPESKGIVEALVGYSKADLMVPLGVLSRQVTASAGLAEANEAAEAWCEEVNATKHSEIAAVPAQRLAEVELALLAPLPSLRASIGRRELRKVDKLSCVRFGSARYSVPNRMLGQHVEILVDRRQHRCHDPAPGTGEVLAEHPLVAPGEVSIVDAHYGRARAGETGAQGHPENRRGESVLLASGRSPSSGCAAPPPRATPASAPSWASSPRCRPRTGPSALVAALERAITFGRWRASGVRAILAAGTGVAQPTQPGDALVIELPATASRSLDAYRLEDLGGGS